ncbi:NAD(P)-dependent oxidoreductase [Weissella bombi]|uniref:Phosphoglycerate dehydrogenase n=1 Tax=Weissella bombi TaxID=1505725 RepID=A0A1C4A2J3_9LACO|nr:NAD(P)-dependent oxidoreductase [Weissella bombi]SCB88791.1 Phosphoglycerate dehydrogenase [Weissella bombi]
MTMNLLAISPLTDDDIKTLKTYDVTVITPDKLTTENYHNIDISFGWDADTINNILATPNHQLKWIQAYSAGVDYMPLDVLKEQNIILTNASGQRAVPIAQSVLSYIFYFARGLNKYHSQTSWDPFINQFVLQSLPVVIFGTGQIGQQIAKYLQAFDTPVYGVNTSGHPVNNFDKVYAINDLSHLPDDIAIVVDTLPSTDQTNNFFNQNTLDLFNKLFLFINIGRGATVNESDLIEKLNDGSIKHAALDVTKVEPIPDDSKLWQTNNLLLTQHSTWAGDSEKLFTIFMKNLPSFIAGEPLTVNVVNYKTGY